MLFAEILLNNPAPALMLGITLALLARIAYGNAGQ